MSFLLFFAVVYGAGALLSNNPMLIVNSLLFDVIFKYARYEKGTVCVHFTRTQMRQSQYRIVCSVEWYSVGVCV